MSAQLKNVTLAGAAGNAGSAILKALVQNGSFNITALCRSTGGEFPAGVSAKIVDFGSAESLTAAMKGQDVVIDATGNPDPSAAVRLMDAAVSAGVDRFIPAEFSNDPKNELTRALPVFQGKAIAYRHLEKLAAEGKLTFTAISNGAFLDWALRNAFVGVDLGKRKIVYMNDGTHVFPWTLLTAVGTAVANALLIPEKTKNRTCYIYSIQKSQKEIAEVAMMALGADGWDIETRDMGKAYNDAMDRVSKGDFSFEVMADLIRYSISTPGYSGPLSSNDNALLGIKPMDTEDIKGLIQSIAADLAKSS